MNFNSWLNNGKEKFHNGKKVEEKTLKLWSKVRMLPAITIINTLAQEENLNADINFAEKFIDSMANYVLNHPEKFNESASWANVYDAYIRKVERIIPVWQKKYGKTKH